MNLVLIDFLAENSLFFRSFCVTSTRKGFLVEEEDSTDGRSSSYFVKAETVYQWMKNPPLSLLCWGCEEEDLLRNGAGLSCHTWVI